MSESQRIRELESQQEKLQVQINELVSVNKEFVTGFREVASCLGKIANAVEALSKRLSPIEYDFKEWKKLIDLLDKHTFTTGAK